MTSAYYYNCKKAWIIAIMEGLALQASGVQNTHSRARSLRSRPYDTLLSKFEPLSINRGWIGANI